jgi:DNA-binding CsgD family transcriptional regulator
MLGIESLALARETGDRRVIAASLSGLAMATREPGDFARAIELYEESLAIYQQLGDTHGIAYVLLQEGLALWGNNDRSTAVIALEESLRLYRDDGDAWGAASVLHALGTGAYYQGQFRKARSLLVEGLASAHALEHGILISMCLAGLSWVAAGEGRFEEVAQLHSVAENYQAVAGVSPTPGMRATTDAMLEATRNALSSAEYALASERGRQMTVEQVIADQTQARQSVPSPRVRPAGLTRREVEVLRLVATGMTNAEVADRLVVSPRTIDAHLLSIYGKLEIKSRSAATRFAVEHGIVE